MIEYKIYQEVYDSIIRGIKKVEIRLLNDKSSKIKIGDEIRFNVLEDEEKFLLVKVTKLYYFDNLDDLWNKKDFVVLDENTTKEEFTTLMYNIFGEEKVKTHKIIGIEFSLIK